MKNRIYFVKVYFGITIDDCEKRFTVKKKTNKLNKNFCKKIDFILKLEKI